MRHPLLRPKFRDPKVPDIYGYHLGMEYSADAMEMVFNQPFTNPAILHTGAASRAGSLRVTQQPQIRYNRQAIRTGIPTMAGQFTLQPLIGEEK